MHIGFTGTRQKINGRQVGLLIREMQQVDFYINLHGSRPSLSPITLHHGDCVGGDELAHQIAVELGWMIVIHPPTDNRYRSFCKTGKVIMREPYPYLVRNKHIVDASEVMIVVPEQDFEVLRSGTWSTWRRAVKERIPTTIIYPTKALVRERHE